MGRLLSAAIGVCLLVWAFSWAPAHAGVPPKDRRVVLLISSTSSSPRLLQSQALEAALIVQLSPYGAVVQTVASADSPAVTPGAVAARQLALRHALAAVWVESEQRGAVAVPVVHVLRSTPGGGSEASARIPGEMVAPNLERAMAVAARVLIFGDVPTLRGSAGPSAVATPERDVAQVGGSARGRASPSGWLLLAVGYGVDVALGRDEWLHGPEVMLGVRRWHRLELSAQLGYRLPPDGANTVGSWKAEIVRSGLRAAWTWPFAPRWELLSVAAVRGEVARVTARQLADGRQQRATLWEAAVGAGGGARFRMASHWSIELAAQAFWLPLSRRLALAGEQVVAPARVTFGSSLALMADFF